MSAEDVIVSEWAKPKGYSNGRLGKGRVLHIAGQVGWNAEGIFEKKDMLGQFTVALDNVLAVVKAARGAPTDVAEMTVYVTDMNAYRAIRGALGPVWKDRFGRHYPAMALVEVKGLLEPEAVVEVQAIAYVEEP